MRQAVALAGLAFLATPMMAEAQLTADLGLAPGISEADAGPILERACDSLRRVEIGPTRFPAALEREVHLVCHGLTAPDGTPGGDAIFSFADDALVMTETRGAAAAMTPTGDPNNVAGPFDVYYAAQTLVDADSDRAIQIGQFDLAPLAIAWDNPLWHGGSLPDAEPTLDLSVALDFGASVETMMAQAETLCTLHQLRDIDEVWLLTAPARQQQLDCFGPVIAGYPRKIEFVFGDGMYEQAWILFGNADTDRLRASLTARHGAALSVDETYEIFDDWRLALRKDVVEIRAGSDRLAALWQAEAEADHGD